MFKFFWINYRKCNLFLYLNNYHNFKNQKTKKVFIINNWTQTNFFNFKKYDINVKNNVNSRDIVIQYLFDSKFSVFLIFVKLIMYLLLCAYMLFFIIYAIVHSLFIVKPLAFLILNFVLSFIFLLLFLLNFCIFAFSYVLLFNTKFSLCFVFLTFIFSFFKISVFMLSVVALISLLSLSSCVLHTISFLTFKSLLLCAYFYVLLLNHIAELTGFNLNENLVLRFKYLLKKINLLTYISIAQSLSNLSKPLPFLYFFKLTFCISFTFFKFLLSNTFFIIFKKPRVCLLSQKVRANSNFLNFFFIDNGHVSQTAYLLKYNYMLIQKLKFQNFVWHNQCSDKQVFFKKKTFTQSSNIVNYIFFIKNIELLNQPETVLYWKNFNKSVFLKSAFQTFVFNDMSKNNVTAFVRNSNQVQSSSNLQYSNTLFKRSFQYNDIINFYLQNKNNNLFDNNAFNYNYVNSLSKKWDQSRFLFLLNDSGYNIIKNTYQQNTNSVVHLNNFNLTFII